MRRQFGRVGAGQDCDVGDRERTFSLTPDSLRNLRSLSSLSVLRQNMEWSKGAIFLMATFLPLDLCTAEQTMPYAPSPTTSSTWYCVPERLSEACSKPMKAWATDRR